LGCGAGVGKRAGTDLVSVKLEGRATVIAPP
jgi:hypothetical protein